MSVRMNPNEISNTPSRCRRVAEPWPRWLSHPLVQSVGAPHDLLPVPLALSILWSRKNFSMCAVASGPAGSV